MSALMLWRNGLDNSTKQHINARKRHVQFESHVSLACACETCLARLTTCELGAPRQAAAERRLSAPHGSTRPWRGWSVHEHMTKATPSAGCTPATDHACHDMADTLTQGS